MGNDTFKALAHPIRRTIVERLASGESTVGVVTEGLGVSKPVISKHLKVLEECGVVGRTIHGRTHRLRLDSQVLGEASSWIDRQRAQWELLFDTVEQFLAAKGDRE